MICVSRCNITCVVDCVLNMKIHSTSLPLSSPPPPSPRSPPVSHSPVQYGPHGVPAAHSSSVQFKVVSRRSGKAIYYALRTRRLSEVPPHRFLCNSSSAGLNDGRDDVFSPSQGRLAVDCRTTVHHGRDSEKRQAGSRCLDCVPAAVSLCGRDSEKKQAGSHCLDCVPAAVSRPLSQRQSNEAGWYSLLGLCSCCCQSALVASVKVPPSLPSTAPYLPRPTHPNLCGRMGKRRGGDEGSGVDGVPYGP